MKITVNGLEVSAKAETLEDVQLLLAFDIAKTPVQKEKSRPGTYMRTCKVLVNGSPCGAKAKGLLGIRLHESLTHGITNEVKKAKKVGKVQCILCGRMFKSEKIKELHARWKHSEVSPAFQQAISQ